MRTKLLSFLLIISFIVGSVPIALAQEVAESIASEESTETAVPAETQGEPESVITADTGPETALEIPEAPDFEPIELEARALDARVTDVPVIEELLAEPPVAVSVETEISLPNGCTAEDTEDTLHIFPLPETISAEYLAICALAEAAENGSISGFELTNNPSFGLYVTAVDGREADS
ncbi:MAG: hypothetical protein QOE22_520, partial [Candidatus Parcubacteria bacterium]|nr:hypothetical protein [Candidatus Parcubacteria bacterium]